MAEPLRVYGYHGTTIRRAGAALRNGFRSSRNDYDWLGDGVYFFQDAPRRAWEWATARYGANAAVIRSVIRLEGHMELIDTGWFDHLDATYTALLELARRTNLPLPRQTAGALRIDREVFNHTVDIFATNGIRVRAIRGVFVEGIPLFPGSAIHSRAHI